ncbi:hypothetical protein UACE39S_05223 [Ureibacillus acetophenoni]
MILREITEDNAPSIFACFSNEKVTRFYGQESLETIEQAKAMVDLFAKSFEEKRGIRWGIEIRGSKGLLEQLDLMHGHLNINVLKSVMKFTLTIGEKVLRQRQL